MMKHFFCLALLTFAAHVPRVAGAEEPSAADRATARRLGTEGVTALRKGNFDTAADRFGRANDLVPAPTFQLLLARARVGQGRFVEAYELYRAIIREGVAPDQPDAFKRALAEAKQEVKLLEPRLAWVTVNVVGAKPDQVEVTLNGSVIPSAALGAQRPVDPGALHVEARGEGFRTAEADVQLSEGQHLQTIELSMVERREPVRVDLRPSQPVMTADGGEPSWISQSTLGYIALGLGGAGLAVGSVTGVIAIDRRQALDEFDCVRQSGNTCWADRALESDIYAAESDLKTFATAANIGFAAGGALALTGLILLATAPDDSPEAAVEPTLRPYLGLGSVGAVGTF